MPIVRVDGYKVICNNLKCKRTLTHDGDGTTMIYDKAGIKNCMDSSGWKDGLCPDCLETIKEAKELIAILAAKSNNT